MKKIYSLFLATVCSLSLLAQENVAPKAKVSASPGCSTGACELMIDGNYGTCGTQRMWISGGQQAGQWFQFLWDDPYFFAGLKVWHAQNNTRFMCGFILQRLDNDGVTWVNHQTFSNIPMNCENEFEFDVPFFSKGIRLFNFTHCGSQLSNANFRQFEVYAFSADIEVENVKLVTTLGTDFCRFGTYPVDVTLKNNGPGFAGPIDVQVILEGGVSFTETVSMLNVDAGNSKTFRMNQSLNPGKLGAAIGITAKILTPDTDDTNNELTTTMSVITTPNGSAITPTSTYPGFPKQGTQFEKDIITYNKTFVYEISPPTKYTNNQHGIAWVSSFSIFKNGSPLPGSRYSYSAPSGSNNATVTLNLLEEDVEAEIRMNFNVIDAAGNGCDTNATRFIYVAPMPKPLYDGTLVCFGDKLQFQNRSTINSGGLSYVWHFGDGSPNSTLFEPQHMFTAEGVYQVKLVATSTIGFKDSITFGVEVSPSPVPDFAFQNQCGAIPVSFTNLSTLSTGNMSFYWYFGDGGESSMENPAYIYANPGPYEVTLTIESDKGCFSELKKSAYSYPNPKADFIAPSQICVGSQVNFLNQTTIPFSTWGSEWNFGENNARTFTKNPQFRFRETGDANVKLKVTTQYGCVDSIVKTLSVAPGPFIEITHSNICINDEVKFYSNVQIPSDINASFIWNIDGNLYADKVPTVAFNTIGQKNVSVNITYDNGCTANESVQVAAGYKPKTMFDIGPAVCSGEEVNLENSTTIDFDIPKYTWNMGDGMVYNELAPRHTYNVSEPTDMQVVLIATSANGACPDTMIRDIRVGLVPTCDFDIVETYLPGHRGYTFVPAQTGASYKWLYGDGRSSTNTSPVYQYERDGNYNIRLVITTEEGCQCEATKVHSVYNLGLGSIAESNGLSIFPNPSTGVFTIKIENNLQIQNVTVTDVNGKVVFETTENSIDLSDLNNGVYFVMTTVEGVKYVNKVVLNK